MVIKYLCHCFCVKTISIFNYLGFLIISRTVEDILRLMPMYLEFHSCIPPSNSPLRGITFVEEILRSCPIEVGGDN